MPNPNSLIIVRVFPPTPDGGDRGEGRRPEFDGKVKACLFLALGRLPEQIREIFLQEACNEEGFGDVMEFIEQGTVLRGSTTDP